MPVQRDPFFLGVTFFRPYLDSWHLKNFWPSGFDRANPSRTSGSCVVVKVVGLVPE